MSYGPVATGRCLVLAAQADETRDSRFKAGHHTDCRFSNFDFPISSFLQLPDPGQTDVRRLTGCDGARDES